MNATAFRNGFYDVRYTLKNVEHFDLCIYASMQPTRD